MKKFLSLLMAVMMMATVLTACGGSKTEEQPASTDGDKAQEETQAPASTGSELTFTTGGSSGTYYAFGSVLAGQISDCTGSKITAVEADSVFAQVYTLLTHLLKYTDGIWHTGI